MLCVIKIIRSSEASVARRRILFLLAPEKKVVGLVLLHSQASIIDWKIWRTGAFFWEILESQLEYLSYNKYVGMTGKTGESACTCVVLQGMPGLTSNRLYIGMTWLAS
jgi:hypothetical protein